MGARRVFSSSVVTAAAIVAVAGAASLSLGADGVERVYAVEELTITDSLLVAVDIDGDCIITSTDLAAQLALRIDSSPGKVYDADGDGKITGADTLMIIETALRASTGDVDGDGVVSEKDLDRGFELLGEKGENLSADVDGNGAVDELDLKLIASRIGEKVDLSGSKIASQLYDRVLELDAAEAAGLASWLPSWCWPFDGDNWPDGDHLTTVSSLYPPGHGGWTSDGWPPNHFYSITNGWYPCPAGCHGTLNSSDEAWPPNHDYAISKDWTPQHSVIATLSGPAPTPHSYTTSDSWPPNHDVSVTSSYPPTHTREISSVWPPNHLTNTSNNHDWPTQTDHFASISASWTHNPTSSSTWPPSHPPSTSGTWVPGHISETSIGWPPSHSSQASGSWPPNTYPGNWPPNHHGGVSATWTNPPPVPPGLFPPGHAYIPSVREFIP